MKKIVIKTQDEGSDIRVKILNLIIEKKFKKAKELADKYISPIGFKFINYYKEGMSHYKDSKSSGR